MLKQPDYLGNVGSGPRVAAAVVVGAFALLFGLMTVSTAIATAVMAFRGEWDIVPVVAGSGAGCGLLAAGLVWVVRRLRRPAAGGGVAVFPLWFIQAVGAVLLPGAAYAGYLAATTGGAAARAVPVVLGPPVAMLLVPWLVRRRAAARITN